MERMLISLTFATIFICFAVCSHAAYDATFGETNIKVTIRTGSYPLEQRWVLYKLSGISETEKIMSDSCPGWIDGSDPNNWAKRYGTTHSFSCMEPDFKFISNGNYNSNVASSTTNKPYRECTICSHGCSCASQGSVGGFQSRWYGNPGNDWSALDNGPELANGRYDTNSRNYVHYFTLDSSATYRLKIFDTWGDGWNGGSYKVDKILSNGTVGVIRKTLFASSSNTNNYVKYSDFQTDPVQQCPPGYYCPTPSQMIACGNYTVYCPQGSYYPTPTSNGYCGSNPAITDDYSTCTAQQVCPTLQVLGENDETLIKRLDLVQPESGIARIVLRNPATSGGPSISWSCPRNGNIETIDQKTTGEPAWAVTPSACFSEGWNSADGDNKEWLGWQITKGFLRPQEQITIEVLLLSAEVSVSNSTYKSYLNMSYVTPARAVVQPPVRITSLPFHMTVAEAQAILVFPFRIDDTLRVGESRMHDIYVFNIGESTGGQTYNDFGIYIRPASGEWNESISSLLFSNPAPWAQLHTSVEEPVCTNQSVLMSSLPANCKVRNDRTFKKIKLELNTLKTAANVDPYVSSLEIRNTIGETVNVNLKLTVTSGETSASASTTNLINNTEVVVGSTLNMEIFAKDILGGNSEDQDTFYVRHTQITRLVNGQEKQCSTLSAASCSNGELQATQNIIAPTHVHTATLQMTSFGTTEIQILLRGETVGLRKYTINAVAPICPSNAGLNGNRDGCECIPGYEKIGTSSNDDSLTCAACPANSYKSQLGNKPCISCPLHSSTNNMTSSTSLNACECLNTRVSLNVTEVDVEDTILFRCQCDAGYEDNLPNSTCTMCSAGKFQTFETGNPTIQTCELCEAGKISSSSRATNCTRCMTNQWSCPDIAFNDFGANIDLVAQCSGQIQCRYCPNGTAGVDGRACTACIAGRYNDVRGGDCKDCQKGKYQSGVGNSTCISCAIGTYKAEVASSTRCDLCPSNSSTNFIESIDVNNCTCGGNRDRYYRSGGSFVCRCLTGYGKSEHDSSRCSVCPPGKNSVENNQQELTCVSCEAGQYTTTQAQQSCKSCQPNQWTCPMSFNGTDSSSTVCSGKTSCVQCPKGRAGNNGKDCNKCPPGSYNADIGSVCQACPTGQYQEEYGKSKCVSCPRGKYNDQLGSIGPCIDCAAGRFSNSTGSTGCDSCESGKYQSAQGKASCIRCSTTSYSPPGSIICTECPTPLLIDDRLGLAKDESHCVCQSGFFLYPSIIITIVLNDASTSKVSFGSSSEKLKVRGYIGEELQQSSRSTGLQSGLPYQRPYEKVELLSYGSVATNKFRAIFKILPASANASSVDETQSLFATPAKIKQVFEHMPGVNGGQNHWYENFDEKSSHTSIKKECIACPTGGKCPFGITGEEDIVALPGFWRPKRAYARFWGCFTPSMSGGKFYPWLSCYGGVDSACGPVFRFDQQLTHEETIKDQFDKADFPEMPKSEFDYTSALNTLNEEGQNETLDYALVYYLNEMIHLRGQHDSLDMFIKNGGPNRTAIVPGYRSSMKIGDYSGPLCSICPAGSGRDGNFQSGSICSPCPDNETNTNNLMYVAVVILLVLGMLICSQVTKGSKENDFIEELKVIYKERGLSDSYLNLIIDKKKNNEDDTESDNESDNDDNSAKIQHIGEAVHVDAASAKILSQKKYGTYSGRKISHKEVLTGMFRILAAYLQVTALAQAVPIEWPEAVLSIFRGMETISSPSLSMTSVDCAIAKEDPISGNTGAFYKKFYTMMAVPIIAIFFPLLLYVIYYALGLIALRCCSCTKWPGRKTMDDFKHAKMLDNKYTEARASRDEEADKHYEQAYNRKRVNLRLRRRKGRLHGINTLPQYNEYRHWNRSYQRWLITVILILFLFYTTISKSIVSAFACQQFGEERYLIADFSVDCNSETYNNFLPLPFFFFVLYCFGIPFAAYRVLRRYIDGIHYNPMLRISAENPRTYKKELDYIENDATRILLMREKHISHQSYGFLWQGLNEKGYAPYWEVSAVTLRKLFMIFIVMMFQDSNKNIQMVIALMGLFVFTASHIRVKPYDSFVHDKLEIISLFVSQATMFTGLIANFIKEDQKSDRKNLSEVDAENVNFILGAVIVFCNFIFMFYFGINLMYHAFFMLDESVQAVLNKFCGCCLKKKTKRKSITKTASKVVQRINSKIFDMNYTYHSKEQEKAVEMTKQGVSVEQKIQQVIEFVVPPGSGPGKNIILRGANNEHFAVTIPNYAHPGTCLTFTLNPTDGGKHVRRSITGSADLSRSLGSIDISEDSDAAYEYDNDDDASEGASDDEALHLVI